jgi:hypothetical protein
MYDPHLQGGSAATCSRWFLARRVFYPEDAGYTFLRNVRLHKIYTAPHHKKTAFFIVTAVETSNLTVLDYITLIMFGDLRRSEYSHHWNET